MEICNTNNMIISGGSDTHCNLESIGNFHRIGANNFEWIKECL